jgi:hypothetical protein
VLNIRPRDRRSYESQTCGTTNCADAFGHGFKPVRGVLAQLVVRDRGDGATDNGILRFAAPTSVLVNVPVATSVFGAESKTGDRRK